MLNIIQKKGVPDPLSGQLIAYARVLPGPPAPARSSDRFHLEDLVQNGLLAVSGEFKDQLNLRDFLRREFSGEGGPSVEDLANRLRAMGEDLPEGLSPDELRRQLESLSSMEIIPVPAKVLHFDSEEELLQQNADIFFLGEFQGVQHAHLAVTSFPILYQALYREQQSRRIQADINALLDQVDTASSDDQVPATGDPAVLQLKGDLPNFAGNLLELLMSQVVPNLVYNLGNPPEFMLSMQNFRAFMDAYRWPEDLVSIEDALMRLRTGDHSQNRHLELICRKISALHHEEFEKLPAIQRELEQFKSE